MGLGSTEEPSDGAGPVVDAAGRLLLAARDDPAAFGALYDSLHRPVLAFFYRRTACPHTSAELLSETFAQALAGVGRYRPDRGTGRAWLFGIAGNLYKRWLRTGRVRDQARRRFQIVTPTVTEDDLAEIEQLVDFAQLRDALRDALASLPAPTRDAIVLRFLEELPYSEIAARLRCTEGNARVRVARGLDRLGLELGLP